MSTATRWIPLMSALDAPLTNEPYSKISGAFNPFTLTLTSPILHLSLLLSLTECGQVPQICNAMERLRVWLPILPMATHWISLTSALPLMLLWPTNRTRKSLEISTPFMLTLTSPILHLSPLLSLTECGQVPQICNAMERLRVWLPLSPTARWIPLTSALPLMLLWPTNRTRKSQPHSH